jgi:hypothetical protein
VRNVGRRVPVPLRQRAAIGRALDGVPVRGVRVPSRGTPADRLVVVLKPL